MGDFKQWRFFSDGQWQKDFRKATPVFAGGASEFSLSYLPGVQKYVAVYMQGGILGTIVMRIAPAPEGPWSEPRAVFRCPELDWDVKAFPTIYVLDAKGVVRYKNVRGHDMEEAVNTLLAEMEAQKSSS